MNNKGFTLIEVIIVISIFTLLLGTSSDIYSDLFSVNNINNSKDKIIQTLRVARERSINRFNNSRHGVRFILNTSTQKYILYQGSNFSSRAQQQDVEYEIERSLSVTTDFQNNDANFSFKGKPRNNGIIIIQDKNSDREKKIKITKLGIVTETN